MDSSGKALTDPQAVATLRAPRSRLGSPGQPVLDLIVDQVDVNIG